MILPEFHLRWKQAKPVEAKIVLTAKLAEEGLALCAQPAVKKDEQYNQRKVRFHVSSISMP